MGFSFIASASGTNNASGTILDCSSALNVQAGDVLVCIASWEGGTSTIGAQTTTPDNAMTMLTTINNDNFNNYQALGYKLVGEANASATFRMTLGTTRGYRSIGVMQFRPDSGETITLEAGPSGAQGTGSSMASGSINPSGDDLILFAAAKNYNASAFGAEAIGGTAADGSVDISSLCGMWYRLLTSAPGSVTGTASGYNATWVADILAIKSVAAGNTGDAIHSQQRQTQAAAGKQTLAGVGIQAQKVQTHAAAGKQTLAGIATHAQQRQTSVAAGTLGVAGIAIHSQQVQTHAGAGKETFIGTGVHAQELQTSVAAGYVPFLGVVIQSQQVQTHIGEGTVTGAFNGIGIHAQQVQTHAAAGKETFPGVSVHSQRAQTQVAVGYVPFAGVVTQSQQPQTQAAAGAVPYSGVVAQSQALQTQAVAGTTPVEEAEVPAEIVAIGGAYTVDLRTLTATRRIIPWAQEVLAVASARQPAQTQRATGRVKQFISSKSSTCQQAVESEAFAIRDYEARDQREMLEILEALVA